jgi:hypothetical protein
MTRRAGLLAAATMLAAVLSGCVAASDDALHVASADQLPPVAARVDYQLGGPYPPPAGVTVVTRDRTVAPADGAYGICYVNAFQAQPDEDDTWTGANADLLLKDAAGHKVIDEDWDEPLLDTSTEAKRARLADIVGDWIDGCAEAGFDAVEPDNLDSWTRSDGLLTSADNLAFAALLADRAHEAGLAIAQKNAGEISAKAKAAGMDFAVAEECEHYRECGLYTKVYGRHVIEIEYADQPASDFTRACAARGDDISIERRDRDVVPAGADGYVAQWC